MLKSVFLLAVLGAVTAFPNPEQEHNVVKRQTVDIMQSLTSLATGIPIYGVIAIGLIIAGIIIVEAAFVIYFAYTFLGFGGSNGIFGNSGRSTVDLDFLGIGNAYNSLDFTEIALNTMNVRNEACKYRAVCIAERAAVNNPIASLAINTINARMSGLGKYSRAVEAGLNGEDCELLYDQCNEKNYFF